MSAIADHCSDLIRRGIFHGADLNALAKRLWALDSMRAEKPLPHITWRALSRPAVTGTAWRRSQRIVVRLGPDTYEKAAEVILHELVHCTLPPSIQAHGELFKRRLIACAREAFDLDLDTSKLLALPKTGYKLQAYAIDAALIAAMKTRKTIVAVAQSDYTADRLLKGVYV